MPRPLQHAAARVVTGDAPGGWQGGYDPATAELMKGAELTRGLLLQQDAVASHFPRFPKTDLTKNNANMVDVRTGSPMTADEAKTITQHMADATGGNFFSPVFTQQGHRFINVPEASGMSNVFDSRRYCGAGFGCAPLRTGVRSRPPAAIVRPDCGNPGIRVRGNGQARFKRTRHLHQVHHARPAPGRVG
jgi:hypothetical protein